MKDKQEEDRSLELQLSFVKRVAKIHIIATLICFVAFIGILLEKNSGLIKTSTCKLVTKQ